jgi:hypothetical protein
MNLITVKNLEVIFKIQIIYIYFILFHFYFNTEHTEFSIRLRSVQDLYIIQIDL